MTVVPLLTNWFDVIDSEQPDRVLDLITADFELSILFATEDGAAEFSGDRSALAEYLDQREKSTLTHHILRAAHAEGAELVLGETRRDGAFEASFNASAEVDTERGLVRRLLICRTPRLSFDDR